MKNSIISLLTLLLICSTSCNDKIDYESDKQALINLTAEEWDKQTLAGNINFRVQAYTEDAVRIGGNGEILAGIESIRSAFTNSTETILELDDKVEQVWISGNLSAVRGSFTVSFIQNEVGDTINLKGFFVDICERQADGSWKMAHTLASQFADN